MRQKRPHHERENKMSTSGSGMSEKQKQLRGETHVNTVGISVLAKEPLPVNRKCRLRGV